MRRILAAFGGHAPARHARRRLRRLASVERGPSSCRHEPGALVGQRHVVGNDRLLQVLQRGFGRFAREFGQNIGRAGDHQHVRNNHPGASTRARDNPSADRRRRARRRPAATSLLSMPFSQRRASAPRTSNPRSSRTKRAALRRASRARPHRSRRVSGPRAELARVGPSVVLRRSAAAGTEHALRTRILRCTPAFEAARGLVVGLVVDIDRAAAISVATMRRGAQRLLIARRCGQSECTPQPVG